jgi:hypothetical protein
LCVIYESAMRTRKRNSNDIIAGADDYSSSNVSINDTNECGNGDDKVGVEISLETDHCNDNPEHKQGDGSPDEDENCNAAELNHSEQQLEEGIVILNGKFIPFFGN